MLCLWVVSGVRGLLGVLALLLGLISLSLGLMSGVFCLRYVVWRVSMLHLVCMFGFDLVVFSVFLVMVSSLLRPPPIGGPSALGVYQRTYVVDIGFGVVCRNL